MKALYFSWLVFISVIGAGQSATAQKNKELADMIKKDVRMDTIQARALRLLTGFTAGTSYGEVWIRDLNTFIQGSLKVHSPEKVREMLLLFFQMQGADGNIVDGVINKKKATAGYEYRYSSLAPDWAAHKNTVETDQESSLIQAVKKYISVTGDRSILEEQVGEKKVMQRMEDALNYILQDRWAGKFGLVKGATTADWGDVQPETGWGVAINEKTKWSVDIYDNAMYALAIKDFLAMLPATYKTSRNWSHQLNTLKSNTRKYLWDKVRQKYIPHLYLNGSPFSERLNEAEILYTGGSACAILAGFHTPKEIAAINSQMVAAAAKQPYATIGITVYPPYPAEEFPNMHPYVYQNGGDWTWFGGRMIQGLIENGFVSEAVTELSPMLDRVLAHKGFYEWYDVRTGEPKGSGDFRGEAGVLYDVIMMLRQWAAKQ